MITTLKKKVEYILANDEKSRNSDIRLTQVLWLKYHPEKLFKDNTGNLSVRISDLYTLPREDNIKRVRAKIQNEDKKYLPTDLKVVKQRKINEKIWHDYMAKNNPAYG